MTISSVIPLYNKRNYIVATLMSVRQQTLAPDEIIVVDDGSTDGGADLVRALDWPDLKVICTDQPRSGPSAARNAGIRAASSRWIAFIDADDFWLPDYLGTMVSMLTRTPEAICAFSSWYLLDKSGTRTPERCGTQAAGTEVINLHRFLDLWHDGNECPMWTSATMIARDTLLRVGGFPETFRRGEDKDTWLRVMATGVAAYTPQPLAIYNQAVEGQATSGFKPILHPVVGTVDRLLAEKVLDESIERKLRGLSNLEIWKYTRQAAFRSIMPRTFITRFHAHLNPLRYVTIVAVCLFTAIGVYGFRTLTGRRALAE